MLSNLTSQLKEQGAEDKFYDVLEEVPRVRKDLGEPPLVTPSSQIVGTQAVFNVLMGERYKMATKRQRISLREIRRDCKTGERRSSEEDSWRGCGYYHLPSR